MTQELTYLSKNVNIPHFRGDSFVRGFTLRDKKKNPIDLGAGATARMVFFDKRGTGGTELLEWSTATGEITITQVDGVYARLEFNGPDTDMNPTWESAEYDIEILTGAGRRWTPLYGKFYFKAKQVAV
ncbi:hypothetical protein [Zhongshania sp.]|uniref:hypothetical protein n=1 Tax=Zhongshania sp. TaxID=1971902 RepID=UPI0035699F5E